MQGNRVAALAIAVLACCQLLQGQAEYRVYQDRPRLFLESGRLERLRKDVGRETPLWLSLQSLLESGAALPEQPMVDALLFQVAEDRERGLEAAGWTVRLARAGIRNAGDLRQAALVYDWCHGLYDDASREAVRSAVAEAVDTLLPQGNLDVGLLRAGILASISLAGDWDGSEPALAALLRAHWDAYVRPELESGGLTDDGASLIAILETTLAVRHNLETDLLQPVTRALASLVRTRLLGYYPADIETSEGLARRPSHFGTDSQSAGVHAPLYRIADFLLVAYEANLREFQFVQGWIRDDNYQLRSPMAAPYEFLWVNPYLPGLTPQSAPNLAYDEVRGRLYARLDWQRPTTWIGYAGGRLELLSDGGVSGSDSLGSLSPLYFSDAAVVPVQPPARVTLSWQGAGVPPPTEAARIYFIGLRAGDTYGLKVGGRPAKLATAGPGGILLLRADPNARKQDRIDLRRKIRIELKPTLKPTDPRRPRPTLRP